MDFEVSVKNKILGDSKRVMSMDQLMTYNACALACAKKAAMDGKSHTWGMWTVSPVKNTEQQVQPDGADKPLNSMLCGCSTAYRLQHYADYALRRCKMKTQEEINELKRQWEQDPCWDIEDTEGFEYHACDLLTYRKQKEIEWEKQKQEEIEYIADSLGVPGNVKLVCAFIALQKRIEELEKRRE